MVTSPLNTVEKYFMMLSSVLLILGIHASSLLAKSVDELPTACDVVPNQPSCVCKTKRGVINLTSLAFQNSTPAFSVNYDGKSFFYNPCNKFQIGGSCSNNFLCDTSQVFILNIGSDTEQIFVYSNGTPAHAYYPGSSDSDGNGKVILHCSKDTTPTFAAYGVSSADDGTALYTFNLSSCHVCPGGCKGSSSGVSVGIVGLVLLILFLAAIVTYFVVGALIMKFKYSAQTFTETVPNSSFWIDAPFLIKDGCVFTFKPIVDLIKDRKRNEYEQIK